MTTYVCIFENIRNNWITEATQELEFYVNDQKYTARGSDIKKLYYESKELVKMSRLTFEAVWPTPIERQRVGTCLRVFCDETMSALKVHPEFQDASWNNLLFDFCFGILENSKCSFEIYCAKKLDNLKAVINSN